MKSDLDKRLLIINPDEEYLIFIKNECKETKKIFYNKINKIQLSPKDNPKFDIIIHVESETV